MYRLLIVEDDMGIAEAIEKQATAWGLTVKCIKDFQSVMQEFAEFNPHLILMDIGLPFFDGYYWCSEIRKVSKVPIIFISSASDNMNIIMAMNMGADDFISKPFDLNVITAKIQALLRRTYSFTKQYQLLTYKDLTLNLLNATISYQDIVIDLTKNELKILQLLFEKAETFVSREEMMMELWQTEQFVDDNTLSVNVNRLRKKLEIFTISSLIQTKKGIGYQLYYEESI